MVDLPSGTVTFLFSEIEGSTRHLIDLGQDTFARCLAEHDDLILQATENAGGFEMRAGGGGTSYAVFSTPSDAVDAVVDAQRLLQHYSWPEAADIRVRMGIHTGPATLVGDDYIGINVHRAARIGAAGFGAQVLMSADTAGMVGPHLPAGVELVDLGEVRLKDLGRETLYQLQIEGLISEFPTLKAAVSRPTNLPVIATSFVGRDRELAEVDKLIRGGRMVTITGVGGAGKTRLALQVAAGVTNEFADGVWFVELSTVTDPELVATEVAHTFGIREQPGEAVRQTLLDQLARKSALIVMDNCEHVISEAARLISDLTSTAPACNVIATSRELLRVEGEIVYRLQSMSVPAGLLAPAELGQYDAVRLFVERAAAIEPGFSITDDNAPAIAEICRRLDGIPLAIELAAARTSGFSPEQIVRHIDVRFQLLSEGSTEAVPRQQTLDATIDWSYRLLDEREQLLFARLSVFQGGFDLEAAQFVCSADGLSGGEVLGLVSSLIDKSLVSADVGGAAARFRVFETLRRFGADRLVEAGPTDSIRRRHAEYFSSLAEEAEPNVRGEHEREWRDRIDLEQDNFHVAMEWSLAADEPESGMRIAGAMWRFWKAMFRYSVGVRWLSRVFEAGPDVDKIIRAKVMLGLGTLESYTGASGSAAELLEGAIAIYRELDSEGVEPALLRHGYPSAVISLATNLWQHDQNFDRATELWGEALEIANRLGDAAGASAALGNLAEAAGQAGDIERARVGYIESIQASYALNSTYRTVEAIFLSAVFELSIDEPGRAIALLDDAIDLARSDDLPFWADFARAMRAVASHDLGEPSAREQFMGCTVRLFADDEFRATVYYQLPLVLGRADFEHSAGNHDGAATLLGALEALEAANSPLEPIFEGTRRRRLLEALEVELGVEALAANLARGRALTLTEAINLTTD